MERHFTNHSTVCAICGKEVPSSRVAVLKRKGFVCPDCRRQGVRK